MPADLKTLYGHLRAQLLSRHFALGRQFRADHLSFFNYLGVVHQTGGTNDDTQNDLIHGCMFGDVLGGDGAEVTLPGSIYKSAPALLKLGDDERLFERWRVGDHWRENPLLYSGQLMVCLAVEIALGVPGSVDILSRLLATTKSLFKFSTAPYDGYILRWDPATSDQWTTVQEFEGPNILLDQCCDFLTDSSTPGGFLFCTPFDDPRYTPYLPQSDFDRLTSQQMPLYQQARRRSILLNRYWEPSEDELVGLLTGYSFVHQVVSDPSIQAEIADQAKRIGGYLSANAYLLVRPGGGFAARGGSDICPALEFPFGRIFSRITGSEFSSQTNFEGALQNAGLWSEFSQGFSAAVFLGIFVAPIIFGLAFLFGGPVVVAILAAIVATDGTVVLGKAAVIWLNYEAFDVSAFPGNSANPGRHDEQRAFAGAYLLGQLPKKLRFTQWMFFTRNFGKYAQNFPPFLGPSAFGDSDSTVTMPI